jgi:hypothetical protein
MFEWREVAGFEKDVAVCGLGLMEGSCRVRVEDVGFGGELGRADESAASATLYL